MKIFNRKSTIYHTCLLAGAAALFINGSALADDACQPQPFSTMIINDGKRGPSTLTVLDISVAGENIDTDLYPLVFREEDQNCLTDDVLPTGMPTTQAPWHLENNGASCAVGCTDYANCISGTLQDDGTTCAATVEVSVTVEDPTFVQPENTTTGQVTFVQKYTFEWSAQGSKAPLDLTVMEYSLQTDQLTADQLTDLKIPHTCITQNPLTKDTHFPFFRSKCKVNEDGTIDFDNCAVTSNGTCNNPET